MILYRPTDGDVLSTKIDIRPKTCFIMTQLGEPGRSVVSMRKKVETQLKAKGIKVIDANSKVTGKDFLDKIWRMIVSVPLGVAIIHEDMSQKTIANIFYEMGIMDALGKLTIVVKSPNASIPSDFVRTEYIETDRNFRSNFLSFLESFLNTESYFAEMAEYLENNPLLSIDYLRRAHLVSGNKQYSERAKHLFNSAGLGGRAKNSVETLLADF